MGVSTGKMDLILQWLNCTNVDILLGQEAKVLPKQNGYISNHRNQGGRFAYQPNKSGPKSSEGLMTKQEDGLAQCTSLKEE
jgi:hypothetical protein